MELRQLRYFEKAAELLNFTEAAKELFISQGTLSQQIKQLEDELGVLLFDRIGKHVVLTEAGQSFLTYARKTINNAESGKQIIRDLQGIETGSLHIGSTFSLNALLTKALDIFSRQYPKININITFATSEGLIDLLRENKMDFVLSFKTGDVYEEFETIPLFSSRLHFIVHESHQMGKLKMITMEKLSQIPLILPAKGFVTREILDEIFGRKGLKPTVNMEMNDVQTIINLAKAGNWGTILTFAATRHENSLVKIPISSNSDLSTHASLFWTKGSYRKKSALAFASILSELTRDKE